MTKSFCRAFASRALSQKILVWAFLGEYARSHVCRPVRAIEGSPCKLCKEMCITFPRSYVRRLYRRENSGLDKLGDMSDICMTSSDFAAALKARPDGDTFLRDEGKFMVLFTIEYFMRWFDLDRERPDEARIIQRLEEERVNEPTEIVFYSDDSLSSLECIVENGFDPKTLKKEEVMEKIDIVGRRAI